MNALKAMGDQKSAPIYVHTSKQLKSVIVPGDLEIPDLTNIHQVWPHVITAPDGGAVKGSAPQPERQTKRRRAEGRKLPHNEGDMMHQREQLGMQRARANAINVSQGHRRSKLSGRNNDHTLRHITGIARRTGA